MKRVLFILLSLTVGHELIAQNNNEGMYQEFRKTPIAPSPDAAAIGKFGDIPVSLNTGIPSISIPFYAYQDKMKNLSLSVGLSYHAGGHKVEDMASNVGLGWALNAGGVISRTMRGRPDDDTYGYLNTAALPNLYTSGYDKVTTRASALLSASEGICYVNSSAANFNAAKDVAESTLDGEADIFQFSVGGVSGKFFIKKNGQVQLVSQSNLKITFSFSTSGPANHNIEEFVVTDPYGVKYIFNEKEYTDASNSAGSGVPPITSYASSWYISRIISADELCEIKFYYSTLTELYYEGGFADNYKTVEEASTFTTTITQSHNLITTYSPKRINAIHFPDSTKVLFFYDFARLDYIDNNALTEVRIKNAEREKKFLLNYSYFESNTCTSFTQNCTPPLTYVDNDYYKRLKLVSVQETDGTQKIAPYLFEYNPTKLPVRNSKEQDWWGFFNGIGGNTTLVSTRPVAGFGGGGYILGGDRSPSLEHTKAWVLDKIFYPTGGSTRFVYELNDGYHNTTTYRSIGGLRVQRTEDYDPGTTKLLVTKYTYKKTDNTSSGDLQHLPNYSYNWTTYEIRHPQFGYLLSVQFFLSETSTPSQSLSYFSGSPVIYTRVKQEKIDGSANLGYSVFEYTSFAGVNAYDNDYPYVQQQDFDWRQGLLLKELHYNSSNSLVRSIENEYDYFMYPSPPANDSNSRNLVAALLCSDNNGTIIGHYVYGARAYHLNFGRAQLKKTTEKIAGQTGAWLETITNHTYDTDYFLPLVTKTKKSNQNEVETRNYYPFSYSTTGFTNRTAMLNANRVAEVVSQESWEKISSTNYLKSARVNDYDIVNSTLLKQNQIYAVETASLIPESTVGAFNLNILLRHTVFKEQIAYTAFDARGRFSDMQTPNQEKTALVWGISNNYPIATVKNASTADIAYTSFEDDGGMHWQNINSSNIVSSKGVTGLKFYQSSAISLQKTGLNSAVKYLVSYWSKNGAVSVTGTQSGWPKTGRTTTAGGQNWTFYEHLVTGLTSVTVSTSFTCAIDELRLSPQLSEMSTVAYNALTGVTEQADANGNIMYYEYDGFFRLHLVRDYQGNILKQICYSYQNQAQTCAGLANAAQWQPTGAIRCKPCPANSLYISDQQEREEKDLNTSSSTYNQTRWVSTGTSSSCAPPAVWSNTSSSCELVGGVNTGRVITVQTDVNPCSPTYNTTREVITTNYTTCPQPGCTNCNGVDEKCISGVCEAGAKVYLSSTYNWETGLYDCEYRYVWSDQTYSQTYVEQNSGECPLF